jgi:DNA-3-methyladenine glycosylase II
VGILPREVGRPVVVHHHGMEIVEIEPRGPFSLAAARDFAGGFPAGIGGGSATETSLVMAFALEEPGWGHAAVAEFSQPTDGAPVRVMLQTTGDPRVALAQALRTVSLDRDGSDWPAVGERDSVIGDLQLEQRYLRPVCFYSAYEAATSFVIGQRIARTQSAMIKARLADLAGDRIDLAGRSFTAFPRPARLLELDEVPGLTAEKMTRLHGLARAALDGRLDTERLRGLPTDAALAELRTLRGIGEFTAEAVLLRGCGIVDEVPTSDAMGPAAVAELYALDAAPDAVGYAAITDGWRPYRMWAVVLVRVGWGRRQVRPVSYRRDRSGG